MLLLIAFLVGVDANNMTMSYGCQTFAGLIQYFMLSTFSWMAIEGVNLYGNIVKIFKIGSDERFLKFALCFGWGKYISIIKAKGAKFKNEFKSIYFHSFI